jgi:hypothetical protein
MEGYIADHSVHILPHIALKVNLAFLRFYALIRIQISSNGRKAHFEKV